METTYLAADTARPANSHSPAKTGGRKAGRSVPGPNVNGSTTLSDRSIVFKLQRVNV